MDNIFVEKPMIKQSTINIKAAFKNVIFLPLFAYTEVPWATGK